MPDFALGPADDSADICKDGSSKTTKSAEQKPRPVEHSVYAYFVGMRYAQPSTGS